MRYLFNKEHEHLITYQPDNCHNKIT